MGPSTALTDESLLSVSKPAADRTVNWMLPVRSAAMRARRLTRHVVVRIPHQYGAGVGRPLQELERTATRLDFVQVALVFVDNFFGDDARPRGGGVHQERCIRRLELDRHRGRIGGFDAGNRIEERLGDRRRVWIEDALVGVLDVGGGQFATVVKLDTLAQMECVRLAVG